MFKWGVCLMMVAGFLGIGCGSSDQQTETLKATAKTVDGSLSNQVSETVRESCRQVERNSTRVDFVCPSLVPRGPTQIQVELVRPDYFSLDFVSPSIAVRRGARVVHLGHWLYQGGSREAILNELTTNSPSGLPDPLQRFQVGGIQANLYRIDGFENVHAGHEVVVWEKEGSMYAISVHGADNRQAVLAMARSLIQQMDGSK
ncbi:MAG: hypothetical protein M3Y75_05465 [Actinomycetota bacterium]|nr:hypothetical protein [Actinomycetota bacterium]